MNFLLIFFACLADDMAIDWIFTFNLSSEENKYYTQINFMNTPPSVRSRASFLVSNDTNVMIVGSVASSYFTALVFKSLLIIIEIIQWWLFAFWRWISKFDCGQSLSWECRQVLDACLCLYLYLFGYVCLGLCVFLYVCISMFIFVYSFVCFLVATGTCLFSIKCIHFKTAYSSMLPTQPQLKRYSHMCMCIRMLCI